MSSLSYTYAKALNLSFTDRPQEDFFLFLEELKILNKAFQSLEVKTFFLSPIQPLSRKKDILRSFFKSFKFHKLTQNFLFLLLDKKRWKELPSILTCLIDREQKIKGEVQVEVAFARPPSAETKALLIKQIESFLKKKVILKEHQTKNLIGGMKVLLNDGRLFNDTLLFHLTSMENQIRRNFYDHCSGE